MITPTHSHTLFLTFLSFHVCWYTFLCRSITTPSQKCRCDHTSLPSNPLYFSQPRFFFVSEWSLPQRWHLISISLTSQTCNICSSSHLHSSTCDLPTAVQSRSLCHFLCRHSALLADPLEFGIQMYQSHQSPKKKKIVQSHELSKIYNDACTISVTFKYLNCMLFKYELVEWIDWATMVYWNWRILIILLVQMVGTIIALFPGATWRIGSLYSFCLLSDPAWLFIHLQ